VADTFSDGPHEFLALGMSKGSIYLVHVNKLHQLYCRFTIHREEVTQIRQLHHSDQFVSFASEYDLCFWRIDKDERMVKVLSNYQVGRNLSFFLVLKQPKCTDRVWLCFESGDQEVFEYDGS